MDDIQNIFARMQDITLVMTTYIQNEARWQRAFDAKCSWARNLKYEGQVNLHLADDGSKYTPFWWDRGLQTYSQQFHEGVGASLNKGLQQAFEVSDFFLYAVDDWVLTTELDLTPWAQLLEENPSIGMVRLGPPHPNLKGQVEMFKQGWGLRLERYGFAFGHRPALYHKRFIEAYGVFEEQCSALECERLYNEHFSVSAGPDILLALYVPYAHDDSLESLSGVEPCI